MKKKTRAYSRALNLILAVAMLLTAVLQSAMTAQATVDTRDVSFATGDFRDVSLGTEYGFVDISGGDQNPDQEDPDQGNPDQENPDQENPDQENPDQENPDQENPDQENPGQGNLGQENPGEANPSKMEPNQQNPEDTDGDASQDQLKESVSENDVVQGTEQVKLEAVSAIEDVILEGLENGVISQEINSRGRYPYKIVSTKPGEGAYLRAAAFTENPECGYTAEDCVRNLSTEGKTLCIDTALCTGTLRVVFYDERDLGGSGEPTRENIEASDAALGEFQLVVKAPAWAEKAPTVRLARSSDTSLWFQVTPPAGYNDAVPKEIQEKCYYKITAKQKDETSAREITEFFPAAQDVFELKVLDAEHGMGKAVQYMVTAQLYCINPDPEDAADLTAGTVYFEGVPSKVVTCATKNPYLAESITAKIQNKVIYNGQRDVPFATIQAGKQVSYVSDEDFLVTTTTDEKPAVGKLTATLKNGVIYLSAEAALKPGKYTVTITANQTAGEEQKVVSKTLAVQVKNAIRRVSVFNNEESKTQSLFKQKGKAVSVKLSPVLTGNEMDLPVATPKVSYSIGYYKNGLFWENANVLGKGMVTVKNGVVTIHKNFVPNAEDAAANRFCVQIQAADYAKNASINTVAFFEVKAEKEKPGKLVLGSRSAHTNKEGLLVSYVLDGSSISCADVKNAGLYVLKDGAVPVTQDASGNFYSWEDVMSLQSYTLTINNKLCSVNSYEDANGYMIRNTSWEKLIGKKITYTATMTDGSKTKVKGSFIAAYADVENVGVKWFYSGMTSVGITWLTGGADQPNYLEMDTEKSGSAGTGTILVLTIGNLNEAGDFVGADRSWNYSLSVSGGEILKDSGGTSTSLGQNQQLAVRVTGKQMIVSLKKAKKTVQTYYIINKSYDREKNAPKITLENKKAFISGGKTILGQSQYYTMSESVENAVKVYALSFSEKDVQFFQPYQMAQWSADLEPGQTSFESPGFTEYPTGSGKLCFLFVDAEGNAVTHLSNPVTIKAAPAKHDFKLKKTYTVYRQDAVNDTLSYTGSSVYSVEYLELRNEIRSGKANCFKDYFRLENGNEIRWDPKDPALLETKPAAKDLTGYVMTKLWYKDGTTQILSNKITIRFKTGYKSAYKVDKVSIDRLTTDSVPVTVYAGKAKTEVPVYAACVDRNRLGDQILVGVTDGKICLTFSKDYEEGTQKVDLYVVPKSSPWARRGMNLSYEDVKKYGRKLTLTITYKNSGM